MFVLSLIVAMIGSADARHHRSSAQTSGFDFYLLSLSLAPSFCSLSPRNQAKDECQQLTETAFEKTPLTIHGLWPNRARVSVNQQPFRCSDAPIGTLSPGLQADLAIYMPGGADLRGHEWEKHGTCSGLSPEDYFGKAVALAKHANDVIGGVMRDKGVLGGSLNIRDLLAAVATKDPALAPAIVVDCAMPRGGGASVVVEIRVLYSKDFAPISARSVGMGQNSGCPGGQGGVPGVSH
jgi:ribonuclease T2